MDPQFLATLKDLVSTVGFPIFVAAWLLFRTDKILRNLTEVVEKLCTKLDGTKIGGTTHG